VFPGTVSVPQFFRSPLRDRFLGSTETDLKIFENTEEFRPDRLPPNGIPLHTHRTEDEAWYVLEGVLRFRFGNEEFNAPAGAGVLLPKGIPHTFWNPGPDPVRYLLIVRPKTAALLDAVHRPGPPDPRGARAVYASFDVDLLE
jgi:mannose-6-phosphate isomerase-like protein (cupin superfamily)